MITVTVAENGDYGTQQNHEDLDGAVEAVDARALVTPIDGRVCIVLFLEGPDGLLMRCPMAQSDFRAILAACDIVADEVLRPALPVPPSAGEGE